MKLRGLLYLIFFIFNRNSKNHISIYTFSKKKIKYCFTWEGLDEINN